MVFNIRSRNGCKATTSPSLAKLIALISSLITPATVSSLLILANTALAKESLIILMSANWSIQLPSLSQSWPTTKLS